MKYLENVDSAKPISRIGLGTWQFGSREWGYGEQYNSQGADQIVARAAEMGITLFDTAEMYGFGRSETILGAALAAHDVLDSAYIATKHFPLLPIAPLVRRTARASAGRVGHREDRPVPGPPAQPGCARRHDHGRDARPAGLRAGRRRRREQLLAGPLEGRGAGVGPTGAVEPGAVQPRAAGAVGRPRPPRRGRGPGGDRLEPAGPGTALGAIRRHDSPDRWGAHDEPAVPRGEPRACHGPPGRAA